MGAKAPFFGLDFLRCFMTLQEFFNLNNKFAVAFSGGVDSSYLLYAAKKAGCDVRAYFIKSPFQPEFELEDAKKIAELTGAPLTICELDVLSIPEIANNPPDRCYTCKRAIMAKILSLAEKDGYPAVCDGANADDAEDDRPGMRAARELGILSPLRDCGLTKAEIRRLSKDAGLFTHEKPSYACLATRIPTGREITPGLLTKTERAEQKLFEIGFSGFRVRLLGNGAKLELPAELFPLAVSKRAEILDILSDDYEFVYLDLKERC